MVYKLAFLFLTKGNHNSELAWELFFKNINIGLYKIYSHPKTIPSQLFLKNNIISNTTNTRWGDSTLVKATLLLLESAYQDIDNQHFILVSDSCIPIVNFNTLYNYLSTTDKSLLYWRHNKNRLDRYLKLSQHIRKHVNFKNFYSQHQWMILCRKHVKLTLHNNILNDFLHVHACDEHYFVTLFNLLGILKTEFINKKTTYCDWSDTRSMHPKTFNHIDKQLIDMAHSQQTFFIRKIGKQCNLCKYLYFILQI